MRNNWLARPNWAKLSRVVADGYDKIEHDILVFIPRLWASAGSVDLIRVSQHAKCVRIDFTTRVRTRAVGLKFRTLISQRA
jgi:hypothetical protein